MKNKNKPSNQVSYPLRIMAGVYLIYLAYSLVKTWGQLDNKLLFGVFIGIFGIVGGVLLITSVLGFLRNRNAEATGIDTTDSTLNEVEETPTTETSALEKVQETDQVTGQETDQVTSQETNNEDN